MYNRYVTYSVRKISREELSVPLEWAAEEGWNPGLHDADAFYAIDPRGFFMGFLDGRPISSLSAVSYGPEFGFLGLYIVKKEFRGQGYGWKLWQEALKHLPTQNIGLDGVVAEQENYKKSGFRYAYRNIRYEGRGRKEKLADPQIMAAEDVSMDELSAYDRSVFLYPRVPFLTLWIKQPQSLAICYRSGDTIMGYGMIRPCRTGYKIGPLFSDSPLVANLMLRKMLTFAGPDSPVFLDVPETNPDAVRLAESQGMTPSFETARMYTKDFPAVPFEKIFGITTFEVG